MAKFSTIEVISAAVAVYRKNGNKIIATGNHNEGGDNTNRTLLDAILSKKPDAIKVTEDDVAMAETIINDLQQRGMIAGLKGSAVSDFTARAIAMCNEEQMSGYNIGISTWIPKLHADMQAEDVIQHELNMIAFGSKYIGKIGDKVEINFVPVVVRYNTNYNVWRHTGHDGQGNLVGFLKKDKIDVPTRIKGCVKTQNESRYTKGKTTIFNYVKVIK